MSGTYRDKKMTVGDLIHALSRFDDAREVEIYDEATEKHLDIGRIFRDSLEIDPPVTIEVNSEEIAR